MKRECAIPRYHYAQGFLPLDTFPRRVYADSHIQHLRKHYREWACHLYRCIIFRRQYRFSRHGRKRHDHCFELSASGHFGSGCGLCRVQREKVCCVSEPFMILSDYTWIFLTFLSEYLPAARCDCRQHTWSHLYENRLYLIYSISIIHPRPKNCIIPFLPARIFIAVKLNKSRGKNL